MSTISVDNIKGRGITGNRIVIPSGQTIVNEGTATGFGSNILEMLAGVCDGRTVTGPSGSYTLQNVTAELPLTTTYQDVTGSVISYTPPAGTKTVVYRYQCHVDSEGYSGISHFKFMIDGVEVIPAYRSVAPGEYDANSQHNSEYTFQWPIQCDAASDDAANGKFSSWTSAKTLKLLAREYNSSYQLRLHHNVWRDGAGASGPYNLAVPTLTITAIG